jgi:diguanylate cyclase (GGDEF)-like protein/PAS domain S-box-containing protein
MAGTLIQPLPSQAWRVGGAFSSQPLAIMIAAITLLALGLGLFGAIMDRELASRAEHEARRLRRFADATFEGILFLRDGVVVDANVTLCRLLGRERETVLGRRVVELLTLPPGGDVLEHGGSVEADLIDAAGARRPVELLCRPLGDSARADRVLAVRDLADRKQAEARIQHLAHHDSLTGLANRTLFRDRLAQAMTMAQRTGHGMALLCLDLDGFKAVNDLLGHPIGDQVLIEVGNRLRTCLRDSDTVARLGGDEFAIVQSFSEQPRGAAGLAERLVRLLAEPFEIEGQRVSIGTSAGVALYPSDADTPEALLRNADLALYRAKHDGRGLFRFFEQEMDQRLQQRLALEQELRLAMLREELRLHYQPLLDSNSLEIQGFEALLRWHHPERGNISPAVFVPVAEESGLIAQLGQWVLQTACAEAALWPMPWRIAVNLSPVQFRQRDLAAMVRRTLVESGLDPSRLELEITEGVLIDDAERALTMLRELKALGVRIALDDFGTGYSSLSYLRRFPFDKLKIDASFVQGLGDGGEADAIVRAIVALGRSLSLKITAEGVETFDQLERLREHSCDQVQGFLLGRPMPPSELPLRPAVTATAA